MFALSYSQMNQRKNVFFRDNLEYLGVKINTQGMMPLPVKVQAIKYIKKKI